MTTKVAANNIFASLNEDSDNEAPVVVKTAAKTTTATKAPAATTEAKSTNQRTGDRAPRGQGRGQGRAPRAEGEANNTQGKDNTQRPKYSREGQKPKGVSAEAHPQDRQSGTGISGVEKRFRKDGGGRRNYGTVKNEVDAVNKEEPTKVVEEVVVPVEPEEPEVVDNTITVEEYFQKLGVSKDAPVEAIVERKLNLDELKREKLEVVASRADKALDATTNVKKSAKAQNKNNTTYLLGCNTENSQLLGVKTGHTLVKYTVKMEGGELVGEEKRPNVTATTAATQQQTRGGARTQQPKTVRRTVAENETDFPKLA